MSDDVVSIPSRPIVDPNSTVQSAEYAKFEVAQGTKDTLNQVGGTVVLGTIANDVSIAQYVGTGNSVLNLFNSFLDAKKAESNLEMLRAQAALIGNVPSQEMIQDAYDQSVVLLNTANGNINALNGYNSALSDEGAQMFDSGSSIQDNYDNVVALNFSSLSATQLQQVQNLITQFQTNYPTMTESQFKSQLSAIVNATALYSDGEINTYNSSADDFNTYNDAVSNYNDIVGSAPITQDAYNTSITALTSFNEFNAEEQGNILPTLEVPAFVVIEENLLSATQSSIPDGAFDNLVTWPNVSTYSFTTGGSSPTINTAALNQFLSNFISSVNQAQSVDTQIQSSLNAFLTTDYVVQTAEIDVSPTIPLLTVPTITDFESSVLQNYLSGIVKEMTDIGNTFSSDAYRSDPSSAPEEMSQKQMDELKEQKAKALAAISLGSVAGIGILNIGGLTNFNALTEAYVSQLLAINAEAAKDPNFSESNLAYRHAIGNYLQTVVGASSVLGTLGAFKDATNLFSSSDDVNSSLLLLNILENLNSITGEDLTGQLDQLVEKAVPNATGEEKTSLIAEAAVPFAFATAGQTAVLAAQNLDGDQAASTALYLAAFTQNALDLLGDFQSESVYNAQNTLLGLVSSNNVAFSSLGDQALVSGAFQLSSQQLGVDLTDAQNVFFASLNAQSGPLSVDQVKQLLLGALGSYAGEVPVDAVANSVIFHFVQNEESYRIQTHNLFKQNEELNHVQADQFTERLVEATHGSSEDQRVQFLIHSDSANDERFAENLAMAAVAQQQNILGSHVLDGEPNNIPGTDILKTALVARADMAPVPTEQRTTQFPV